jgi:hypothetical protein
MWVCVLIKLVYVPNLGLLIRLSFDYFSLPDTNPEYIAATVTLVGTLLIEVCARVEVAEDPQRQLATETSMRLFGLVWNAILSAVLFSSINRGTVSGPRLFHVSALLYLIFNWVNTAFFGCYGTWGFKLYGSGP